MDGNSLLACARGFLVCDLSLFLANVASKTSGFVAQRI
jgi:hypothetical protein